jgi:PadR family transcriptional regulator AphA
MTDIKATQTSYAVLGLLALKPWTTYELAQQSERSLRWFFPRAERAVYLEAKRLVTLGWAQSTKTATGRRTSTVYTITRTGRAALRAWLAAPSAPPQLESEGAIKIFFADQAGTEQLRATVELLGEQADWTADAVDVLDSGDETAIERQTREVLAVIASKKATKS